ncbi:exonuclease [Bacillus salacetis]|uniref:Exonuclease n=1 Tax=Bacillus salacetis TaxID=2315464 RepID=A0A3A1QVW4_9BACI|nr:exonuclease domain-containing protein [Bacillus salacetis]RIW32557.1 exonuclease [Bacillus salacetis]
MDFIALDFEIANHKLSSACSLGMVFVEENVIVDKKSFLIKPPGLDVDPDYTKIHGITREMLKDAPSFPEIWSEIHYYFSKRNLFVAHNAQFDMNVLKNTLLEYSIQIPEFEYVCSIPVSTRACRGERIGNSLKERAERFGVVLENHHDALSDARACAELVIKCVESKRRKSLQSYCRTYGSIPVKKFSELKLQTTFRKRKKFNKIAIKDIVANKEIFDENHELYGKNVVFTGDLLTFDRKEAMQKVVDLGGFVKSGVSRKTDFLVVGKQDKSVVGEEGLSSKEKKAYELIEQGIEIKVIGEEELKRLFSAVLL